jgi:hypothetical protein
MAAMGGSRSWGGRPTPLMVEPPGPDPGAPSELPCRSLKLRARGGGGPGDAVEGAGSLLASGRFGTAASQYPVGEHRRAAHLRGPTRRPGGPSRAGRSGSRFLGRLLVTEATLPPCAARTQEARRARDRDRRGQLAVRRPPGGGESPQWDLKGGSIALESPYVAWSEPSA